MNQAAQTQYAYHTGRVVGRYTLLELLGSGGTAEIYRSVHPDLARDLAIKILYPAHTKDPGFIKRFRHEAQTAAALLHPHIVQVYDFDVTEDGLYYIVMQYINGPSLDVYLAQRARPLALEQAYHFLQQTAAALQFAHEQGAIHRDLKPANILLNGDDHVYLTDFGFAKIVGVNMNTRSSLTLGTPIYMAPEQIEGGTVTTSTDVYALGAILYEMLTGRRPYEEENILTLILRKIEEPPPHPRLLNPALPSAVEDVVLKAMALKAEKRFSDVATMAAAYAAAIGVAGRPTTILPGHESAASGDGRVPPRPARRTWLALLPVGLLLLLLGLIFGGQVPNIMRGLAATATPPALPVIFAEATAVPTTTATTRPPTQLPPSPTTRPTNTAVATPSITPTKTAPPTLTPTSTPSVTMTFTPSVTPTRTPVPSATYTPWPTAEATSVPPTSLPPPPTDIPPPAATEPPQEPPTRTPPPPPTRTPPAP